MHAVVVGVGRVQSLITELYPQAIFLPIETNGDGAVNVYSRVQMQLFKAKQQALREVETALSETGQTMEEVKAWLAKHPKYNSAFHKSPHRAGSTAADLIYEVGERRKGVRFYAERLIEMVGRKEEKEHAAAHEKLLAVARRAAARTNKKNSLVTVAPEVNEAEIADAARPPVPAGRKSLRIVN